MFLYNIGIWLFGGAMALAAYFKPKLKLRREGLRDVFKKLDGQIEPEDRVVWVHASSLGEFEQGRPVIEELRKRCPEYKILLTFFSPSGYEVRKNYSGADFIHYLPIDTPRNARRFVRIAHPEIAIFVKYEFWLNYLRQLSKAGSRIFLISAIFNSDQIFFKSYGGIFRRGLKRFERLFVQNMDSRILLDSIAVHTTTTTGDTRFDRVASVAESAAEVAQVAEFAAGSAVMVAGSTWPADEHILAEMVRLHPELKFVIAPHEMDQQRIDRFIEQSAAPAVRYSRWTESDRSARVMIVDTIGILAAVYRYGKYGYIGGGFGVGIHNVLEAATYGLPVAFGPNYHRFKEACDLVELGAATAIEEASELDAWVSEMEAEQEVYSNRSAQAKGYVTQNLGATSKILDYILKPNK